MCIGSNGSDQRASSTAQQSRRGGCEEREVMRRSDECCGAQARDTDAVTCVLARDKPGRDPLSQIACRTHHPSSSPPPPSQPQPTRKLLSYLKPFNDPAILAHKFLTKPAYKLISPRSASFCQSYITPKNALITSYHQLWPPHRPTTGLTDYPSLILELSFPQLQPQQHSNTTISLKYTSKRNPSCHSTAPSRAVRSVGRLWHPNVNVLPTRTAP